MSFGGIMFLQPFWFLLGIPLLCLFFLWRIPSRFLTVLRIVIVVTVILAMCAPVIKMPMRSGTVVVVADRSLSMPTEAREMQVGTINILSKHMGKDDLLGVVSFASKPSIDRAPLGSAAPFSTFYSESSNDASDLSAALDQAISLIPPGDKGRILVVSDGRWTGENPNRLISRYLQHGIAIDYRLIERSTAGDIAVVALEAPGIVLPREAFTLNAWIRVPTSQEIEYELMREDQVIQTKKIQVPSGDSRLVFRDFAGKPGAMQYSLRIKGVGDDPVPENNLARKIVGVEGTRPLLVLAPEGKSMLPPIFNNAGIETELIPPERMSWNLKELSAFSGILIENLPASEIGQSGMTLISEWVKQSGTGLMFTGGKNAYATGGYYKSPLEEIMPVSMELRREHRKLSVAICAVLDTSGSMGATVPGGKQKIDLAKLGAAEIPRVLTAMDEIAVIGYDNVPRYLVHLEQNTNPEGARTRIMQPGSLNYGIFAYKALECAINEISKANAETRHIILFADADHVVEPGNFRQLLTIAKKAGITCSCIGLGTKNDTDARVLMDIAAAGGGQCYFTDQPTELPRLFAQDTMVVARSTFIEEATEIKVNTGEMHALSSISFGQPPKIGGYNLCYPQTKPSGPPVNVAIRSVDEYTAPILAFHQVGLGRVICYTGQADGQFTGDIVSWENYNSFLSSMARWTSGRADDLPNNMLLSQEIIDGTCHIRLHLDPEAEANSITSLPSITTLRQTPGKALETETFQMRWLEPEMLGVTVPLDGSETLMATVSLNDGMGTPPIPMAPICLPYSPEFRPVEPGKGREALRLLAEATGGTERIELTEMWRDIPRVVRQYEISRWLLLAAVGLFVVEIFQRRTGWIMAWWKVFASRFDPLWIKLFGKRRRPVLEGALARSDGPEQEDTGNEKELSWLKKISLAKSHRREQEAASSGSMAAKDAGQSQESPPKSSDREKGGEGGMIGAMAKARRSAQQRTEK